MSVPQQEFAVVKVICDSLGSKVIPVNCVMHGSSADIFEYFQNKNALRARADSISTDENRLKAWEKSLKARGKNSRPVMLMSQHVKMMLHHVRMLFRPREDAIDATEAEQAKDPDEDILSLPPGDYGDLQALKEPAGRGLLDIDADEGELQAVHPATTEDDLIDPPEHPGEPRLPVATED